MQMRTFSVASLAISSLFVGAAYAAGPALLQPAPTYSPPGVTLSEPAPIPQALPPRYVPATPPVEYSTEYPPMESTQPIVPFVESHPVELYPHVVYRDLKRVHPHAVPYLVDVPLPQPRRSRGCVDCQPTCATIKICVPPCETPCVKVRRRGLKYIYDFGKFEVRVMVRRDGRIIVNYDA